MTIRYVSLGGLGEVGMNCAVFECEGKLLVLDCGVSFPDDESFGIDQLVPDFTPLIDRADDIVGIVITHAHQDHIGALPILLEDLDVPVYLPPFANSLLQHALRQAEFDPAEVETYIVAAGERHTIGPFDVEFIHVTHSIPDTLAVALHTNVGVIVHTADFKIDTDPIGEAPIDAARFKALGDGGVRALFSDSTNIERAGRTTSERLVRDGLRAAIESAYARVLVTLFSTNVVRVQSLIDAAIATGRQVLFLGRSLQRNVKIARDLGLLKLSQDVIAAEDEARSLRPEQLLIVLTGSQAQAPTALVRMAFEHLAGYRIEAGDRVIFSARAIPGNEAAIARLKDQIVRRGGHIFDAPNLHCSGHAMRDEQQEMLQWVRPQSLIPVHGDHRFLVAHAALGKASGCADTHVLENGQVLEIRQQTTRVVGLWPTDKICVDGTPFAALGGEALRERRRMARSGVALVTVALDRHSGSITQPVEVQNLGVGDDVFVQPFFAELPDAIERMIAELPRKQRLDKAKVAEAIRQNVNRLLKAESGRRAHTVPVVIYA